MELQETSHDRDSQRAYGNHGLPEGHRESKFDILTQIDSYGEFAEIHLILEPSHETLNVSKIINTMKDKWDQSGDCKKYLQSMESSWDVMRPLYISMLKMFLQECETEELKKLDHEKFHFRLEELYATQELSETEQLKLLNSKSPEITTIVFDKMPEEVFKKPGTLSGIMEELEDIEHISKETLNMLLRRSPRCAERLIATARAFIERQPDTTDGDTREYSATIVLLWILRRAERESVHNSLLNGSLLRSKPDPLRRLGTMCAVEEASSRGPDYASIVVKLFEYGCEVTSGSFDMLDSPAVVCYIDDLVSQNYMDDHALKRIVVSQKQAIMSYCKRASKYEEDKDYFSDLLEKCARQNLLKTAVELYDCGSSCTVTQSGLFQPILLSGQEELIIDIIEKKSYDLYSEEFVSNGLNILHIAALNNSTKLVEYVLSKGYTRLLWARSGGSKNLYPVRMALDNQHFATAALMLKAMNDWRLCVLEENKETDVDVSFYDLLKDDRVFLGADGEKLIAIRDCVLAVLDSTVDDKGVVHYQVLESDKNGRTPDDKMFDVDSPSCIDLIIDMALKNGVDPALGKDASLQATINLKWKSYGRKFYLFPLVAFLLFLLFFTTALVLGAREGNPSDYNGSLNGFRLFCEVMALLYIIVDIVLEVAEFFRTYDRSIKKYLSEWTNWIDIFAYLMTFLIIPFRIANHDVQWVFASLAYITHGLRIFEYTIMYSFIGTYMEVLLRIMYRDIFQFLTVFMIAVLAFGGGLYISLRADKCGQANTTTTDSSHCHHPDETGQVYLTWLTGIRLLVQGSDVIDNFIFGEDGFGWLSAIVYLVFLFLVVVVLLNLLIAQMSNSYESVLQKAHISVTWNRAKLLRRLWKSPWMKAFVWMFGTTTKDVLFCGGRFYVPDSIKAFKNISEYEKSMDSEASLEASMKKHLATLTSTFQYNLKRQVTTIKFEMAEQSEATDAELQKLHSIVQEQERMLKETWNSVKEIKRILQSQSSLQQ